MITPRTRREFLAEVGRGMLVATVGYVVARELGLATAMAEESAESLSFGSLERLVCLMQETPADKLLPELVRRLRSGADLRQLTAAAALANARTFGGEDYVGFHTMMALAPCISNVRTYGSPRLEIPNCRILPPVPVCLGVNPSHAANWRPLRKPSLRSRIPYPDLPRGRWLPCSRRPAKRSHSGLVQQVQVSPQLLC